jgi:NarL family two-component system sensor histidine kinase LiaS
MSRLLQRLPRLQWRLALSYALVTLITLLVLGISSLLWDAQQRPITFASLLQARVAPRVAAYLEAGPDASLLLVRWTSAFVAQSNTASVFGETDTAALVLDAHQQVRASAFANPQARLDLSVSATQAVLTKALRTPKGAAVRLPDGELLAAVPLYAMADNRLLGILVVTANLHTTSALFADLRSLLSGTVPLILFVCLVGVVSGVWASRGVTRRLHQLAQAAHAWSHGAFSLAVPDPSRDELGQLARDLNQMAGQIQSLLVVRQDLAVVEERQRLARDLHDAVKQQVFAVIMAVGAAREQVQALPQAAQLLSEAERLATAAQQELTSLIRTLRPVSRAARELKAALGEWSDDWSRRTQISVELALPDDLRLAQLAEQNLLRVTQEALTNVARHSRATVVQVRLAVDGTVVTLSVQDNGQGFDVARSSGQGLGLESMRAHTEALGGTLHITSPVGQMPGGTRVEARLPLASSTAQEQASPIPGTSVSGGRERGGEA